MGARASTLSDINDIHYNMYVILCVDETKPIEYHIHGHYYSVRTLNCDTENGQHL